MTKRPLTDEETNEVIRRIASNIKEKRLTRGLKQTDMARYGFGYRWYQRLESGRHVPTLPTMIKLARSLEIDIVELFK